MRFRIPNNTKCYGGVSDTNTNSTKYTLETPNNPKYKYFWLFGTPNCYALIMNSSSKIFHNFGKNVISCIQKYFIILVSKIYHEFEFKIFRQSCSKLYLF